MSLLLVGVGGALGSWARYFLGKQIAAKSKRSFPLHTFLINISGAFLLGIVSSLDLGNNGYLFFADGFLGAYTTFSTFMVEGFTLWEEKQRVNAGAYLLISIVIGILSYFLGYQIMQ